MVLALKSLAVAGGFPIRMRWLAGEGESARARATWTEIAANLEESPPSRIRGEQTELPTARLAEYVRRCVAPGDRILVLWYAPEIHYESDRLMAGRHLYFFPTFAAVEDEQRRELEKVMRFAPPVILANASGYALPAKAFPTLVRYVESEYVTTASFEDTGERYRILTRRTAPAPAADKATGWPCYRPT
jgi:hypothetical protein